MKLLNFFAGIALGAMIGWLAGLSVSPVVGPLLGILAPAAVAAISLHRSEVSVGVLLRILGLALGCLVAATAGVYVRANGVLGLKPKDLIGQWREAGLDQAQIAELEYRLIERQSAEPGAAANGVLFAQPDQTDLGTLMDELSKAPPWPKAKADAVRLLHLGSAARLSWIETAVADEKQRVAVLRAWIGESAR